MISIQQILPDAPSSAQALFAYLLNHGPASRVEIARATHLARPTISEAAERLFDNGLLKVLDKDAGATGKRGRIPELYDIADNLGFLLTFIDRGTRLEAIAYDIRREELARASAVLNWSNETHIKNSIHELLATLEEKIKLPVLASTVAVILPVDPSTQRIVQFKDIKNSDELVNIHEIISQATDAPVFIDNHINWGLYAEYFEGIARDTSSVLGFSFGKEFGSAFAFKGHIERGASGRAGELSRLVVGNKLFKDVINAVAVHSNETGLSGFTYLDVEKTAQHIVTHPEDAAVQDYLATFARLAANQMMVLDAEALVFFGPMIDIPGFAERLTQETQQLMPWNIDIRISRCGSHSVTHGVLLGAQRLALKSLGLGEFE